MLLVLLRFLVILQTLLSCTIFQLKFAIAWSHISLWFFLWESSFLARFHLTLSSFASKIYTHLLRERRRNREPMEGGLHGRSLGRSRISQSPTHPGRVPPMSVTLLQTHGTWKLLLRHASNNMHVNNRWTNLVQCSCLVFNNYLHHYFCIVTNLASIL